MGYRRLFAKPQPASPEERERRLAICEECEAVRLQVVGYCRRCKRPFAEPTKDDADYDAKVVCRCGGEIKVMKAFARCGPGDGGCGCPLASRTWPKGSFCPKGYW